MTRAAIGAGPGAFLLACALMSASGCSSTSQLYSAQLIADPASVSLRPGELASSGIAFVTPSTVTGQEEDKPALALAFADALEEKLPGVRVVPLTETLTRINQAGLFESYDRMISRYRDSGLLDPVALAAVGKAAGTRFIALLRMASFQQAYHDRLGIFGLRLLQTKEANIRLTLQIWNSEDGSVAWEGAEEMHMAAETAEESAVSFGAVVGAAAEHLVARIP